VIAILTILTFLQAELTDQRPTRYGSLRMTPQSRRVFLGSAVAAAAGGGAFVLLPNDGLAQADAVGTALDRELLAAVRLMARNQTGEGPRRVATIFRLMAIHHAPKDAAFRAALRAQVRAVGREAILQRTMDPVELQANVRQFGFRFQVTPPNPPRAVREKVLDEFLAHGLTPFRRMAAEAFDKASEDLDRRAGAIRPIIDYNEQCRMQVSLHDAYTAGAALACVISPGSPVCLGITAAAVTQLALLYYYGCR
jgi:hypothetical protein